MFRFELLFCLIVIYLSVSECRKDGKKMVDKNGKGKEHLEKKDFARDRTVPEKPDEEALSLLENPKLFEGDIKGLDEDSVEAVADKFNAHRRKCWKKHGKVWGKGRKGKGRKGKGKKNKLSYRKKRGSPTNANLWTNNIVPYTLSGRYTDDGRAVIARAIADFESCTCIKFVPRTTEANYVHLEPLNGCWSYIGMIGGKQTMSLAQGCLYHGIVQHEIMHAVGFFHEQSRTDREQYVSVNYENIKPGYEYNFNKYDDQVMLDTGYDYSSVMHYGAKSFSKNGLPTISPKQSGVTIGQRDVFSQTDITDINRLYECPTAATQGCAKGAVCADLYSNCKVFVSFCKTWQVVTDGCKNSCGTC